MHSVLIFRSRLLPFSETFVNNQAAALTRYRPVFAGLRRVKGLDVAGKCVVLQKENTGFLPEVMYRFLGRGSEWFDRLAAEKPRLIHAHFAIDAVNALPLAKFFQIPLICTCHGYDVTVRDATLLRKASGVQFILQRRALKREAAHFIAVSDFIKNVMLEKGYPATQISRHYIGVDTDTFRPNEGHIRRKATILFVGRLVEKKGCGYLLEAFKRILRDHQDAELIIIGDGPEREKLERNSGMRVRFLGRQNPGSIRSWMGRATIFCVPSVRASDGDAEGFGLVFAEAAATGLPVVSFASGGVPEAVRHLSTGFLAPERNTERLAHFILELLKNEPLQRRMGSAGRTLMAAEFNLQKQTQQLEELYDKVCLEWSLCH